mmetsp:Transcript_59401/g.124122  ORF Transcript_59401/g.124122 Transcript_59401/m.124122 type:complete len:261 (-) Transcript_59401:68-850(-)
MTLEHWMCHNARPHGCPLPSVEVRPDDDLMHVLWTLVRNNCRVVPVLEREGSRRDTAMLNQCLVGQVSYLLLFRFLFYHQAGELETLQGTLADVGIGTLGADRIISVQASEPVTRALELMSKHGISGVPVVDEKGLFHGIFSDKDILCYSPEFLNLDLRTALEQASAAMNPDPAVDPEALCAEHPGDAPADAAHGSGAAAAGGGQARPLCACRTDDPLRTIVWRFKECRSTRLACTDADGRVQGIVTLTDLFKFLAGSAR